MRYRSTSVSIYKINVLSWYLKTSNERSTTTTLNNPVRHSRGLDQRHWTHKCRRLTVCSVVRTIKLLVVTDRRPPRRLNSVTGVHSSLRYAEA